MKTYLDMDEILRHCRRYIGQEYDEPYLVSAVPEEVIRSLPAADVVEVRHGRWIRLDIHRGLEQFKCSVCHSGCYVRYKHCPNCGAKMDGGQDDE